MNIVRHPSIMDVLVDSCNNGRMDPSHLEDYRWLVGCAGREKLAEIERHTGSLVAQTKSLRASLSHQRAHLVLEQLDLRKRAIAKFAAAGQMFFTRRSLEQATDQAIARVKSLRFPEGGRVTDLCCGIGGDLIGLAKRALVVGVDLDPVLTLLAEANCRALDLSVDSMSVDDVRNVDLASFQAWHIDPDRRSNGRRTSRLEFSRPSSDEIVQLLKACPHAGIKLAPAAEVPSQLTVAVEREWYGSRRECRQQMLWMGCLAKHPGCHAVTVVDRRAAESRTLVGQPGQVIETSDRVRRYVHEPHAAVIAASLNGVLAGEEGLLTLAPNIPYLTSDLASVDPLWSTFEVLEVLPFDFRRVKNALRHRRIGRLEVKKRGVSLDPAEVRRRLCGTGPEAATVLIFPWKGTVHAILGRRIGSFLG